MGNKKQILNFVQSSLLPVLIYTPNFPYLPPAGSDAHEWRLWSVHHTSSLPFLDEDSLRCFSMGSLSWETVSHELLQCNFFQQAAVLHILLQCGSLPQGTILQEHTAPAWVTHGVRFSAKSLLQSGFLMCHSPFGYICQLQHGVFHAL